MSYGINLPSVSGDSYLLGNEKAWVFLTKRDVTGFNSNNGGYEFTLPSYTGAEAPLVFVYSPETNVGGIPVIERQSNNYWRINVQSSVAFTGTLTLYVFIPHPDTYVSDYGIVLWNSSGEVALSSDYKVLKVVWQGGISTHEGTTSVPSVAKPAVISPFCGGGIRTITPYGESGIVASSYTCKGTVLTRQDVALQRAPWTPSEYFYSIPKTIPTALINAAEYD